MHVYCILLQFNMPDYAVLVRKYLHVIPLRIRKLEHKFLLISPLEIFIWYSVIKK